MLSPSRLITASAVAALTGVLMLAGNLTTDERPMPAAPGAYEPGVITPVSGAMYVVTQSRAGDIGSYEGGQTSTDEWWKTEYRVDDERLNGEAISRHNRNIGTVTQAYGGTRMITVRLENDGGGWVGSGLGYSDPETTDIRYQVLLEGQGGYEGLNAILDMETMSSAAPFDVTGVIVSGGLPKMPEPVPAE